MEDKENDQSERKKRTRRAALGDFVTNEQYDALIENWLITIHKAVDAPWSRMLSAYTAQHVFIRCPACGKNYAISDPDLKRPELFECYQQRRGKKCSVQCDQILPPETVEMIQAVIRGYGRAFWIEIGLTWTVCQRRGIEAVRLNPPQRSGAEQPCRFFTGHNGHPVGQITTDD